MCKDIQTTTYYHHLHLSTIQTKQQLLLINFQHHNTKTNLKLRKRKMRFEASDYHWITFPKPSAKIRRSPLRSTSETFFVRGHHETANHQDAQPPNFDHVQCIIIFDHHTKHHTNHNCVIVSSNLAVYLSSSLILIHYLFQFCCLEEMKMKFCW